MVSPNGVRGSLFPHPEEVVGNLTDCSTLAETRSKSNQRVIRPLCITNQLVSGRAETIKEISVDTAIYRFIMVLIR